MLVTGHTGFKGAWLVLWLQRLGASVRGLALPPESAIGAYGAFSPWDDLDEHMVDLRDARGVQAAVDAARPEVVLHLAAQALVPRGYACPAETFDVNVGGTLNLLTAVRAVDCVRSVVVVTSDKVYRNLETGRAFREDDPLGGEDPYSASKACVELIVDSLRNAWRADVPWRVATARAGNVIGGGDRAPDRLVPDVVRALEHGEIAGLRHPLSTRPWQHVLDPLAGYLSLAEHLAVREQGQATSFNFGPAVDAPVLDARTVVERFFELWGSGRWTSVTSTTGREMGSLRLDPSRALEVLGWRPAVDLDTALRWTVVWHRAQAAHQDMRAIADGQIAEYEALSDR